MIGFLFFLADVPLTWDFLKEQITRSLNLKNVSINAFLLYDFGFVRIILNGAKGKF